MKARGVVRGSSLVVLVCASLLAAAPAPGGVGANDDTGKYAPDAGAAFYERMASIGMRQTVITVRWQPSDPLALTERPLLDLTVSAARRAGLNVVFAAYPYPPREVEAGLARPDAFGAWLGELARGYPDVKQFVVGNEPNQPAFWRPQFGGGKQRSARRFGPFLAAGYDALHAVDPDVTVVGVGLSPRGNDRPAGRSNVSTSPVRFLAALGAWYRASGRTEPLMDGLSFHPYPNAATDPLGRGYAWPNAGFVNLDRVKQAVWDAFAGTAQPTTVDGLQLYLDEVGWQVDTNSHEGYVGEENVAVTSEATQASVYGDLVRRAQCDPDVAQVNVFGFQDDPLRTGFQAGLYRADGTARPAVDSVRWAIEHGQCPFEMPAWRPTRAVVGAAPPVVRVRRGSIEVRVAAAEGATARVCLLAGSHATSNARRMVAARRSEAGACATSAVAPNRRTVLRLARPIGSGTLAVRLVAETNPWRQTTSVRRLR